MKEAGILDLDNGDDIVIEAEASFRFSTESAALVRELHQGLDTIFTQVSNRGAIIKMLVVTAGISSFAFQSSNVTHFTVTMSAPLPAARRGPRGPKIGSAMSRSPMQLRPALVTK